MAKGSKCKKEKNKTDFAATMYFQVVGSGAEGAPRSLFVFTENCRYFFNCGEGTQRLTSEHKIKLSMTEYIFITHNNWENMGGLLGIFLTLQDVGLPKLEVHGPPGIESFCNDTKHFVHLSDLKVKYCQWKNKELALDNGPLQVKVIPIFTLDDQRLLSARNYGNENVNDFRTEIFDKEEESKGTTEEENKRFDQDLSLAFICRPAPKPGALLVNKCQELGVPIGPLMGELKKGNSVTLHNGKIVKPEEVTESPDVGIPFIVIDVRNKKQLEFLSNCPDFEEYQRRNASNPEDVVRVIIHFSPLEIVEEPLYQSWMEQFGSLTDHIFINEKSTCMGSESVHRIQYKLNHIYPESFPLLKDVFPCEENTSCKKQKREEFSGDLKQLQNGEKLYNHWQSFTGLTYHIRPHHKIDTSKMLRIESEEFIKESYKLEGFKVAYDEVRDVVKKIQTTIPNSSKTQIYPYILFLGTGSCIPNKTRNTSGIGIYLKENCTMLLDCGEGTYGQLIRFFGKQSTAEFLRHLSLIFISHLHADHHVGLLRILLARKKLIEKENTIQVPKLYLLAPENIVHYLHSYDTLCEPLSSPFIFVSNYSLMNSSTIKSSVEETSLQSMGVKSIKTCFVHHCPQAFGVAFDFIDGWKLVYSGDTMPCENLIAIGEDCDLLIHEATMEDELFEEAKIKRHSTTSQAIEVGKKMKAKNVILTHFSQRYAKVPLLEDVPNNIVIAFDNMIIHLYDLPCLPHLYPAYKSLFSEDINEILKKRTKLQKRKADLISLNEKLR